MRATSQKAILLHSGSEEVLILGTDLQADSEIGLLRFIPFPTEPQVSLAPPDVFETAVSLLAKHQLQFLVASKSGAIEGQAVDMRLRQTLGAHDLTVIKVNDSKQFRSWVNEYFRGKNLPTKSEYPVAEGIVEDYVNRDIRYFVLDFVELSNDSRFIEPVLYRFASKTLYYPLKTSNTFGGVGEIDLILILSGTLCMPSLAADDVCLGFRAGPLRGQMHASTSSALSSEELLLLYPAAAEFFGGGQVFIQMVSYWGDYLFDRDIFVDVGEAVPRALGNVVDGLGMEVVHDDGSSSSALGKAAVQSDDPVVESDHRCTLQPDPGPCKGFFMKYAFDMETMECKSFIYGGCQGVVPFETKDECEALCLKPMSTP